MILLTAKDVAKTLRVDASTVYRLMREGQIVTVRWGRNVRIREEDLCAFVEAHVSSNETIRMERIGNERETSN